MLPVVRQGDRDPGPWSVSLPGCRWSGPGPCSSGRLRSVPVANYAGFRSGARSGRVVRQAAAGQCERILDRNNRARSLRGAAKKSAVGESSTMRPWSMNITRSSQRLDRRQGSWLDSAASPARSAAARRCRWVSARRWSVGFCRPHLPATLGGLPKSGSGRRRPAPCSAAPAPAPDPRDPAAVPQAAAG